MAEVETTTYTFGRAAIYSSTEKITKANVVEELNKALFFHTINSNNINRLYQYYKGDQPITTRKKTVRPEINNKIVENHALEIVDFKKGYVFGEPIQYVRRGDNEDISKQLDTLNGFMLLEDKASRDQELAEWHYIAGTANRMILPNNKYTVDSDESPFLIDTLDPRYSFVVKNNGFPYLWEVRPFVAGLM
jgi:hypothetical protein